MGPKYADILATIILNIIHCTYAENFLSCNLTDYASCPGDNQVCNGTTNECSCLPGFDMVGVECEEQGTYNGASHDATVAVITIFTLALISCGLYLVVRKYNLLEYARQRLNMRRNNDVMYEDVMIGQDDPPLNL